MPHPGHKKRGDNRDWCDAPRGRSILASSFAKTDDRRRFDFAEAVVRSVLGELAIMQERYENPDPFNPDEAYFDQMHGAANAMEDARDRICWKFDLK